MIITLDEWINDFKEAIEEENVQLQYVLEKYDPNDFRVRFRRGQLELTKSKLALLEELKQRRGEANDKT